VPSRVHEKKNLDQHKNFIEAFGIASPAALSWTDWFLSLPSGSTWETFDWFMPAEMPQL